MPGKSKDFQDHLDDLAQRYPEFADQLKGWSELETNRGEKYRSDRRGGEEKAEEEEEAAAAEAERREEPGPLRSGNNLRNTVPDMQSSSSSHHDENDRGQRSQSAPPESSKQQQQSGQFVSKVDISNKGDKTGTGIGSQESSTSSSANQQQKVYHIPIFVEGRDEPILPKEISGERYYRTQSNPRSNKKIPVHRTPTHAQKNHQPSANVSSQESVPMPPPPPPPQPTSVPHSPQQSPTTPPVLPPQQQQHHQQTEQPPPQQPIIKDPLTQVAYVLKEVNELKIRLDAYNGTSKYDKEYMYLDEMLTRNLLKLDNIDTEGKEEVRTARKEAIKRIQDCISQLEAKPSNCLTTGMIAEPAQLDLLSTNSSDLSTIDKHQDNSEQESIGSASK